MSAITAVARRLPRRARDTSRHRLVLATCIAAGLAVPAYFLSVAEVSNFAWDFRAYYLAAEAVLAGEPFVGIETPFPGVSYVYPPVAVLLFVPQAALGGWRVAFAAQTLLNVCAALALAAVVIRTVERRRGRLAAIDRLLVAGFCTTSAPVLAVVGLGQVDLLIALALAGAFLAVEHDREGVAGAALGGAALVKLFPALLGLWLVWRRAWRGLAAAIATGLAGLGLGAVLFGLEAYRQYLVVLAGRSRLAEFAGTVSPNFFAMSLYRPLSQLLPSLDPAVYAPLALAVIAPATAVVLVRPRRFTDRLATYLVALVAMLVVSPASNSLYVVYVYVPVLCLLYLDRRGRHDWLLLAGTVLIAMPAQPAQIGGLLSLAGLPTGVTAAIQGASRTVLTVVSVPLVGLGAIVAWCTSRAGRRPAHGDVDVGPVRAD